MKAKGQYIRKPKRAEAIIIKDMDKNYASQILYGKILDRLRGEMDKLQHELNRRN